MKNIAQILNDALKDAEIELTDDQKAAIENGVKENYRTLADYDKQGKKVSDLTAERDNYKSQYEAAAETLKGFDGKDFDAITKERDEWKTKAEQTDAEWKKQLEETEQKYADQIESRDFNDVLMKSIANEKFTSAFAKDGIVSMIKKKGLKREGEKILGLDDYMSELKESQKDAFVSEEEDVKVPTYTIPTETKDAETTSKRTSVPTVW